MKELSYVHQVLFEQKKTWINKDIEPVLVQLKSIAEEKDIFNPGKGNFSAQTATDVIAKEVGEQLLSETRSEEYELWCQNWHNCVLIILWMSKTYRI